MAPQPPTPHPIRAGTARDVESCVALWTGSIAARDGAQHAEEAERRVREAFARPHLRFAVVAAGSTAFALTLAVEHQGAMLSRLCVAEPHRARGLGRALLADAVQHARDAGCTRVDVEARRTNARAIALYERAGFRRVGQPRAYDDGEPLLRFSVVLTGPPGPAEGALAADHPHGR